ncbi:TetR/AcrR family transcriptional regulator [uncultured Paracoccus sp.]|uniref:TetR/AcrR family transcriptional regulator n=1 Tax=uncultured Paracoccus sp. TaxID=189685 RepID=UPI0025F88FD3|nr:TetR/AcrR family transcriptional regulator [uncultured Paracoccus sp.]
MRMVGAMTGRLDAEAWLDAALRALAEHGPSAVRAEALARALGVTKGSFYWHFADMTDFRARLMTHWRALAYDRFVDSVAELSDPAQRLRALARLGVTCGDPHIGGPSMEPAMRGWGLADPVVGAEVAQVDALRRAELARLGTAAGLPPQAAASIYAAVLGLGQQRDLDDAARLAVIDALLDRWLDADRPA